MRTVEYDNNNNTLYYYLCEMYEDGHFCKRTYHRTYNAAKTMGEYWCDLYKERDRDYDLIEMEIEFNE